MKLIRFNEVAYLLRHFRQVKHVTLNPNGPEVIRIHMIPPRLSLDQSVPSLIVLNGQDIIPINLSWSILLSAFIDEISPYDGKEIKDDDWEIVISKTVKSVRRVYLGVKEKTLRDDLWRIIAALTDIAYGKTPEESIGTISIGEYAKNMRAPHRMDLMISAMTKNGSWNCNQRCVHCYAAGQAMAATTELPTGKWKEIIQKCKRAGIPQITFTGGEPTLRSDLVELVEDSKWFITRLNTNGVRLTKELCTQLYEASLDSVQITLYAAGPEKHNILVGANNWEMTVAGIRNAVHANLNVSVNTPLCTVNKDYVETLKLIKELGVKYVSCSGLILMGNARKEQSISTQLTPEELCDVLKDAFKYCEDNLIRISFTSPGWIEAEKLLEIGCTSIPTCGACLSNMAVAPDGTVVPCQSWLSKDTLGNMLTDPWKKIWNGTQCKKIRQDSGKMEQKCLLRQEQRVKA